MRRERAGGGETAGTGTPVGEMLFLLWTQARPYTPDTVSLGPVREKSVLPAFPGTTRKVMELQDERHIMKVTKTDL